MLILSRITEKERSLKEERINIFFKTFETKKQCVIFKYNSPGEMWYGRFYLRKIYINIYANASKQEVNYKMTEREKETCRVSLISTSFSNQV